MDFEYLSHTLKRPGWFFGSRTCNDCPKARWKKAKAKSKNFLQLHFVFCVLTLLYLLTATPSLTPHSPFMHTHAHTHTLTCAKKRRGSPKGFPAVLCVIS